VKSISQQLDFNIVSIYNKEIVGCVTLLHLDKYIFEIINLILHPNYWVLEIGAKLIERSINQCKKNNINKLFIQTLIASAKALFFYKFGFKDSHQTQQMKIITSTKIIVRWDS